MTAKVDCSNFELTVHDMMDRRESLRENSELVAHVELCSTCAEYFAGYETLESVFVGSRGLGVSGPHLDKRRFGSHEESLGFLTQVIIPCLRTFVDGSIALKSPMPFSRPELEQGRFGVLGLVFP